MAKYIIKHACGHTEEVQLFGKYEDRERRIKWLETQECPECRKAKATAEAAKAVEERGLANLTGSDKQIAWANTIREKAYKCLDIVAGLATDNEKAMEMVMGWKSLMDAKTEAKWWIDNRNTLPNDPHKDEARSIVRAFELLK